MNLLIGENQTNVEMKNEEDFSTLLKMEEDRIEKQCAYIAAAKPDVVITEKGLRALASHFLGKAGISAIRRLRKTDNNRIARATGATIVHRCDEIKERDVCTKAVVFEVKKLGDEYFTFIVDCEEPKACTVILRGASRDVLNEVERNLQDAMGVARNVVKDPRLLPGGGAVEMAISRALSEKAASVDGVEQWPYRAVGEALEVRCNNCKHSKLVDATCGVPWQGLVLRVTFRLQVIPRTLAQNCGTNVIRVLTKLRAKHSEPNCSTFGIDGNTGEITNMQVSGVFA